MSDDLESLPPALRALIDKGAEGPKAPSHVKERLFDRVEATISAAADTRHSPDSSRVPDSVQMPALRVAVTASDADNDVVARGGDREPHSETWGSAAPESTSYVASAVGYAARARLRAARYPLLAAAFAVGLFTGGVVVYALVRPASTPQTAEAPRALPQETPELRPATGTAPSVSGTVPSASEPFIVPAPPVPSARVEPEPRGSSSAGAPDARERDVSVSERALIETARAALARADGPAALTVLARHAREFPNGTFVEEREALAIQALAKTGDVAAAKTRGERFRQRFPRSLFMPVVNEATHSN